MSLIIQPNGHLTDHELTHLLNVVYVEGGYTDKDIADEAFTPSKVRRLGSVITAREQESSELAGMIIIVSANSQYATLS